jgi:hypothetical protein
VGGCTGGCTAWEPARTCTERVYHTTVVYVLTLREVQRTSLDRRVLPIDRRVPRVDRRIPALSAITAWRARPVVRDSTAAAQPRRAEGWRA